MRRSILALLLLLTTALPAQAAQTVKLTYDIRVWDIGIGTMKIYITRDLASYQMYMKGGFGGIAALFSTGDGKMQANGMVDGNTIIPLYMHQNVAWDDEPRTIEIHFKDGNVDTTKIDPPYTSNPDNRHPLDLATLKGVRDPLSATIQLHDDKVPVCSHEAKVFDGRERYDLDMVADPSDPWHCRVTPHLISGYKKKHDLPENKPPTFDMYFTTVMDNTILVPKLTIRPMSVGRVKIELTKVELQ